CRTLMTRSTTGRIGCTGAARARTQVLARTSSRSRCRRMDAVMHTISPARLNSLRARSSLAWAAGTDSGVLRPWTRSAARVRARAMARSCSSSRWSTSAAQRQHLVRKDGTEPRRLAGADLRQALAHRVERAQADAHLYPGGDDQHGREQAEGRVEVSGERAARRIDLLAG